MCDKSLDCTARSLAVARLAGLHLLQTNAPVPLTQARGLLADCSGWRRGRNRRRHRLPNPRCGVRRSGRPPARPPVARVPAALTQARVRAAQSAAGSEPGSAQQRGPAPPPPLLIVLLPPRGRRRHRLARSSCGGAGAAYTSGSRAVSLANAPASPHITCSPASSREREANLSTRLGMRRTVGSALVLRWPVGARYISAFLVSCCLSTLRRARSPFLHRSEPAKAYTCTPDSLQSRSSSGSCSL